MAAADVLVGAPVTGTGGVLHGEHGAEVPTDASGDIPTGLIPQGYVSDEGLTMTVNRETEKIKAWGGDTVRIVQTEFDCTFQWSFLETTEQVLRRLHGESNVTLSDEEIAVQINSTPLPSGVWVFDMKDGENRIRIVCPNAQVSEVDDVTFVHTEVTSRSITVEALPDEAGNQAYMYLLKGKPGDVPDPEGP